MFFDAKGRVVFETTFKNSGEIQSLDSEKMRENQETVARPIELAALPEG